MLMDYGDHTANPPATWRVVKRAERSWEIRTDSGRLVWNGYKTRREATAATSTGWLVQLWDKERRWSAGEPIAGWVKFVPPREVTA